MDCCIIGAPTFVEYIYYRDRVNWEMQAEMDIEREQLYLLTKYDTLINYIKQLYLHISVVIRDGRQNNRDMLKSMVTCFDKAVEDYNLYLIYRRNHINDYLWVEAATLYNHTLLFEPTIVRPHSNEIFKMDLIFTGSPVDGYRMHCELWKVDELCKSTNLALRKLEQTFMAFIKEKLINEHYVEEIMEQGFKVRPTKPKLVSKTKEASERAMTDQLMVLLDEEARRFLALIK